jgi:hypothetical protein
VWSSEIIVGDLLTSDRVFVVEWHYARVRPEHRTIAQDIWPIWILWIRLREERYVVGLGVCPAFVERRVPKRKVLQPKNLPHAVLFYVFVLVYATFPPLYKTARVCILDTVVGTSRHHAAEATFGSRAFGVDVDYALHLWMIKEEAMNRTIASGYECIGEATEIESLYALLAIVSASEKLNACVRVVGIEAGNLVTLASIRSKNHVQSTHLLIQTLVEVIAVGVLKLTDVLLICCSVSKARNAT